MKRMFLFLCAGIFTMVSVLLSFQSAWAIPAFARKYHTSCMTCHAPFPHLTAVGEAFRLNGFKLPNDELYIKDKPVSLGANAYKKMFPDSVWPSDIPGMPPMSIAVESGINTNFSRQKDTNKKINFDLPDSVNLYAGGSFAKALSFYTEVDFTNDYAGGGTGTGATEVDASLMWQGLCSSLVGENHLNLKVGTIGMQDISLPNARNNNRFSSEDYLYYTALDLDMHPGVEINGFGHNWRYDVAALENHSNQNRKDYFASFSLKFGGLGYDGVGGGAANQGALASSPAGSWRDDSIHMGIFAYHGYKDVNLDKAETYDRIGGDVRVNYANCSMVAGYAYGKDRSLTASQGRHPEQQIWFGEADYYFLPWMIGYCRYESLNTTSIALTSFSTTADAINYRDRARVVPGIIFLVRANIKATLEGEFYTKDKYATSVLSRDKDYSNNTSFNIIWAF